MSKIRTYAMRCKLHKIKKKLAAMQASSELDINL